MELNQITTGTILTQIDDQTFAIWSKATETCTIKRKGLIISTKIIRGKDKFLKFYEYIQEYKLNK